MTCSENMLPLCYVYDLKGQVTIPSNIKGNKLDDFKGLAVIILTDKIQQWGERKAEKFQ